MTPEVESYDTTLRDGSQGHGVSFSTADKLRIAERLDAFGVQFIEGGWPGSNPRDIEFFAEAKRRTFSHARLAAFGSTRRKDARDLREAKAKAICRECPVQAECLEYALGIREPHGIWGGLNEVERKAVLAQRAG